MNILIEWIIQFVIVFFIGVAGTLGVGVGLVIMTIIGDFLSDRF